MDRTIDQLRLADVDGHTVLDSSGEELGKIADLYYDEKSGAAAWVRVKRGWRSGSALVPLRGSEIRGDTLVLAYDRSVVEDAPDTGGDERLTAEQEQELLRHYRTGHASARAGTDGNGPRATTSDGRRFRTVQVPDEIVTIRTFMVDQASQGDAPVRLQRQDIEVDRRPWQEGDERRQPAPDGVHEIVLMREELEEESATRD